MESNILVDGTPAALTFSLLANDGVSMEQLYTFNQVFWATQDLWTSSGLINASSLLCLVNTIDWNVEGSLAYAEHAYSFLARDISQDGATILFDVMEIGDYGGSWQHSGESLTMYSICLLNSYELIVLFCMCLFIGG